MNKSVSIIVSAALLTIGLVACPSDKTVVPPPTEVVTTELILNGGFEAESNNWTFAGGLRSTAPVACVKTGTSYGSITSATIATKKFSQTFNVPAQGTTSLKYWIRVQSNENQASAFDNLTVKVNGTVINTLTTANPQEEYKEYTYDLSALAGSAATIEFKGTFDGSIATNFCIDDVSAINSR